MALTHLAIGSLLHEEGDAEPARRHLALALAESTQLGLTGPETLARCELAALPSGDWRTAEASVRANAARLGVDERIRALWLLWRASRERRLLDEAAKSLAESVSQLVAEDRASLLTNVRLHRDIAAAATEHGLPMTA